MIADALPTGELTATLKPKVKGHPKCSTAKAQAQELQALLMKDARMEDVKGAVRAQIARAWVDLQEMRLRLAMKPAPKPIDVSDRANGKRKRQAPGPVLLGAPEPAPAVKPAT